MTKRAGYDGSVIAIQDRGFTFEVNPRPLAPIMESCHLTNETNIERLTSPSNPALHLALSSGTPGPDLHSHFQGYLWNLRKYYGAQVVIVNILGSSPNQALQGDLQQLPNLVMTQTPSSWFVAIIHAKHPLIPGSVTSKAW
ncbi:hypothetical protein CISG_08098 [Coccidioides immitis RMSCC 3703]|uniref:Uncharacterized protein n=1 Tax=Coccidioides immitis RMSCC 3703 TaxID=454286 RepID=A0A0J8R7U3_COCIT|nr:hypothetical protein CISG_08098 [Coccidioides immitis RMSCC 3703]